MWLSYRLLSCSSRWTYLLPIGFSVTILTSLEATASMWYERPRFGEKATSRTLSVISIKVSTFVHFLKQILAATPLGRSHNIDMYSFCTHFYFRPNLNDTLCCHYIHIFALFRQPKGSHHRCLLLSLVHVLWKLASHSKHMDIFGMNVQECS